MSRSSAWSGPLFIVGASRSGTTMMRSAFNLHPDVCLAGETHFFDDLRTRKRFAPGRALDADAAAICADFFRALDDRPYGMKGDPERSPLSRAALTARAGALGGDVDAFFEAYCLSVAERDGKHIWGEKTPRHVFRLPEILKRYPSARVICMVRDPRAVVASYRDWRNQGGLNPGKHADFTAAMAEEERRTRLSYNPVIATTLWRGTVGASLRARAKFGEERVRLVRYEAVIRSPEKTIMDLCAWLELAYDDGMLEVPMQNSSFSGFAPGKGISEVAVARWMERLSPHEIGTIQRIAGKILTAAGYTQQNVEASYGAFLMELLRLPVAMIRAIAANRHRMGNMVGYMWRRMRAVVGY